MNYNVPFSGHPVYRREDLRDPCPLFRGLHVRNGYPDRVTVETIREIQFHIDAAKRHLDTVRALYHINGYA
ncbi:MAG: hypothetical protein S4CHLAM102_14810 [Chlamydiia bacterium]|nr:hypothetical protein [Chlamydiia bacterium]